jgi:hypothetical protein
MNDRSLKKSKTVKVRRKMSETTDPDITVGMPTQIHIRLYSRIVFSAHTSFILLHTHAPRMSQHLSSNAIF